MKMAQSPLELRHLRTLLTLARTGSLTDTARELHLTQSAISYQIKALEAHYGCALFARKSAPPRFSPAGQRLLQLARQMQQAQAEAEQDLQRIVRAEAGQLRISVACHSSFDWLLPANEGFRERWPDVSLDFLLGWQAEPVALLREHKADLVILSEPIQPQDVVLHPLFSFEIVAVLPKAHPLLQRAVLEPQDFIGETLISYPLPDHRLDLVHKVLRPAGIEMRRRTVELTAAIIQLVALRQGVAALPAWSVSDYAGKGYVETRRITPEGLRCDLFAATRAAQADEPFVQDFLQEIRQTAADRRGMMALPTQQQEMQGT
ncbi:LysR family transcriptional regulator [Leeia aquatica]|nr:LysR substrate-binding domain-containing protein [Leeia aquatica]